MERFDLWFKGTITAIGAIFSIVSESLGAAFTVLLVLMAVDFITGMMAGSVTSGLNSAIGRTGFIRKLYVILLIATIYLIEINLFGTNHIGNGICIAYIAIELISITENGGKMGAPVPQGVKKLITMLKNEEGKGEK
ncbi:phage holin family protein [Bacillus sp. FJAT-45350]|uniref:phage holin family protein n=1 Tax=Bacillus sp. FJAT-45350 TaxID=2011014 RepID=UPI0015CEB3C0|nr:phage holin family protein [Bacillus sp. FJAT-45350]